MRKTRKTTCGIGSFVAERKLVMGDAAEDVHIGQLVSALQGMAHRTVRLIAGSLHCCPS